ncbi:MAG: cysteine--tRNA ligase [Bacilli bacterium]|jgi:cysteinyl-tRNA synthetase|nr:cysteine--tRNA ligase [Bacilli bacterium]
MKIFNSMTNKKEEFVSIKPNEVTIYICGPTVYNYIHIGNARPMVVFDTLRRVFEYIGYKVTFISNYTDVDDKIINAAKQLGVSELEVANKFIKAYEDDRRNLNTIMPDYRPRVTEYMDEIIAFIGKLIEKGFAYEVDGDVYFRINKLEKYGRLSNLNIDDLQVGARIEENKAKENALDFTLWKRTDDGINWDSPFSKGRPGWHTECVVMIASINHDQMIDIHGGGMDLKFPHHENEIAQAEGCFHHAIANYWMHNGFINVDDEKMSKSLGNVKWAKDVVAQIGANVFRLAMLSTHYRAPLNFSEDLITSTTNEIDKITRVLKQAHLQLALTNYQSRTLNEEVMKEYLVAMEDDLNTSNAIKVIFEVVKSLNQKLRLKDQDINIIGRNYYALLDMLHMLGIYIELPDITDADLALYHEWLKAKELKDFNKADELRNKLEMLNIL